MGVQKKKKASEDAFEGSGHRQRLSVMR